MSTTLLKRLTDIIPNNTSNSTTDYIPDKLTPLSALSEPLLQTSHGADTSSKISFFSFFYDITWQTWLIVILILALLGINIFYYLANGTKEMTIIFNKIFGPIISFFGYGVKLTAQNAATGTKTAVDIVNQTTTGVIDATTDVIDATADATADVIDATTAKPKLATTTLPVQEKIQQTGAKTQQFEKRDTLEKALNDASKQHTQIEPDDSQSTLSGKSGWCYIGEDNGHRACSQVGVNDMCMSGDIYPSQEICINPSLRP